MVNTGHPSRACKLCRARRIKCDETKPTCLKCAKAKRVCPGYRDSFEINLRDETQTTIRKAKTAALKKAVREGRSIDGAEAVEAMLGSADATAIDWSLVNSTSDATSFFHASTLEPATDSPHKRKRAISDTAGLATGLIMGMDEKVPRTVNTPIEQQALCYFLANYVLAPPLGVGRGVMTFFLPLIEAPGYKESPMRSAFLAMSLAALAGRPNSRSVFPLAHMWYTKAVSELTVRMRDPSKPKDNMMLATSILLAFYEGLASESSLSEVFTHLNGTIAMVKERGPSLLETPVGLGIFEFARVTAIRQYTHCEGSSLSVDEMNWWVRQAVCDRFGHHAIILNARTALLRSEADTLVKSPRSGQKVEQVLALLQKIKDLQQEIDQWFEAIPAQWRRTNRGDAPPMPAGPDPAAAPGDPGVGPGPSSATAAPYRPPSTWSSPVSARAGSTLSSPPSSARFPVTPTDQDSEASILASLTAFPSLPIYTYPNVWAAGKYINAHVCRIVLHQSACRCIAWLCAPSNHTQIKEYRDAVAAAAEELEAVIASTPYFFGWTGDKGMPLHFPCGTGDTPKGLAFMCCIWPLYACGSSIFANRRHRAYIRGRLMAIWEIMGVRQAEVFAKSIVVGPPGAS